MSWIKTIMALFFLVIGPLRAQEMIILQQGQRNYHGCSDAHILANKPDWNTGAEEGLEVTGNGGANDAKHGLLRFDLTTLSADIKIESAWLTLYLAKRRTGQTANKTLAAYRLNRPWLQGSGNDLSGYDGRLAKTGEVSWLYASTPDQPWTGAGAQGAPGDHAILPENLRTMQSTDPVGQWYSWEISDLVRFWLSKPDSNFGLVLREPEISDQPGILNFASSECKPDSLHPKLYIKLGAGIAQTIAQSISATHSSDAITLTWPYQGDRNGDGYAQVALARAGDAQWGEKQMMTRSSSAYTKTFNSLSAGAYHIRAWMNDPDGVQGNMIQTLLNIELKPNSSRIGQLYTVLFNDNRVQVKLTFNNDGNANNSASLRHKTSATTLWQDDGLMTRAESEFTAVLSGLVNGQQYDLCVTLHDADGVEGDSVLISQTYIPSSTEPVRIVHSTRKGFDIQTGFYSVLYDSLQTGAYFWIISQSSPRIVRNAVLTGLPFQVLAPACLDSVHLSETDDLITAVLNGRWNEITYQVTLDFIKSDPGLMRWRCSLQNAAGFSIAGSGPECSFYDRERKQEMSVPVQALLRQFPYCAGIAFGYDPSAVQGGIFYFQNFTSLNDYFSCEQVAPRECVTINSSGFGYERPSNYRPLRQESTVITDAYLYLSAGLATSESSIAADLIAALARVYAVMEKPPLEENDWQEISRHLLIDLQDSRCQATVSGDLYFRSYVAVPRLNRAEAITQLDILEGLTRYEKAYGDVTTLDETLSQNLYRFYNQQHHTMVNDAPNEGVQEGDSWYAIHIHLALSRLAKWGDVNARTLLFLSIEKLVAFAKAVNYEFPVFFRYGDNSAISGSEPDATGGFIYIMLDAYELSRNADYLHEAKAAAEHLAGHNFNYAYEAHFTAATCAALARLYRLTSEPRYLDMSYMPFANLMALSWLWECDYGYAKDYRTFFGLAPMAGAGVITMMEQHHSWTYLREYRDLVGQELPSGMQNLLQGFIAYTPMVLKYSLPPFLPSAAFFSGPTVYESYNVATLQIPLEDLREGWQKSGSLGQQLYGAGGPLIFAGELATGVTAAKNIELNTVTAMVQNHPNPFNASTLIQYRIPADRLPVRIEIFDILGRQVRTVLAESYNAIGQIMWNAENEQGMPASTGVYFIRLSARGVQSLKKIILMR